MKRTFKFLVVATAAVALAGCASRRLASQGNGPQYVPPSPPRPVYPPPGSIVVPQGSLPPGSVPAGSVPLGSVPPGTAAPGSFGPQPTSPQLPAPSNPPAFPTAPPSGPTSQFPVAPPAALPSAPPAASGAPNAAPDRVGYRWQPDIGSAPQGSPPPAVPPLVPPVPAGPPTVLLLPPTPEPGSAETPRNDPPKQLYPPQQTKEPPAAPLPVGIAGFDRARENAATGQRPLLEGLDWLQKANYRTVIFLHAPGEQTDADRQQVERRGMTFVPIEINARELNRGAVEHFLRLLENRADKLFVYDRDGSRTGAMWYVAFRLIDHDNDEVARIKAGSLGQGENREAARDIWRAARQYIEQK